MEPIILNDKSIIPTSDLIVSIIGDKNILWKKIMDYLYNNHKDISEAWKFYNDGKSWLFRTTQKKKTIFWIRVLKDTFRVGFWFGDKAEHFIEMSSLPATIKNDFKNAKKNKFGRSISIVISDSNDADNVIKLIEIKLNKHTI